MSVSTQLANKGNSDCERLRVLSDPGLSVVPERMHRDTLLRAPTVINNYVEYVCDDL